MLDFYLSQIILALALVFDLGSVQLRERRWLISGQALAGSLIATHLWLLD